MVAKAVLKKTIPLGGAVDEPASEKYRGEEDEGEEERGFLFSNKEGSMTLTGNIRKVGKKK